jgi:hypothetical protein
VFRVYFLFIEIKVYAFSDHGIDMGLIWYKNTIINIKSEAQSLYLLTFNMKGFYFDSLLKIKIVISDIGCSNYKKSHL